MKRWSSAELLLHLILFFLFSAGVKSKNILLTSGRGATEAWKRPSYELTHHNASVVYGDRDLLQIDIPFQPLRIFFDTRVIDAERNSSTVNNAKIDRLLNEVIPAVQDKWSRHLSVRSFLTGIPISSLTCLGEYAKYLQEPRFVEDFDLVIVVGADPQGLCAPGVLAYAAACELEPVLDRVIVGTVNFCLDAIPVEGDIIGAQPSLFLGADLASAYSARTGANFRQEHLTISLVDITVHELAHALGQASNLFPYFHDEDGVPRTPRDSNGLPVVSQQTCVDGSTASGMLPSTNTVQVIETADGRFEQYLVTPRVQTIARNFFDCATLPGARLAADGGACFGSHWHERHYFSHLLSPVVSDTGANSLSLLTLALLDDSGWYQVDYFDGSQPSFGINAGCAFVEEDCIAGGTDQVPDWVGSEFCDVPLEFDGASPTEETLDYVFCDPSHLSWTICDLGRIGLTERPYFTDAALGPLIFTLADECPIPHIGLGLNCQRDDPYSTFYPGESVGPGSRCINAFYTDSNGRQMFQPACMSINCAPELGVVLFGQDEFVHVCSYDGEIVQAIGRDDAFFICPRLAAVCPEVSVCESGCYGRGECLKIENSLGLSEPTCRCFDETNTDPLCKPQFLRTNTAGPVLQPVSVPTTSPTVFPSATNISAPAAVPSTPLPPQTPPSPSAPLNSSQTSNAEQRRRFCFHNFSIFRSFPAILLWVSFRWML